MVKSSTEDWQALFNDWQTKQLDSTQKIFDAFGQWQKSLTPSPEVNEDPTSNDASYASMQSLTEANSTLFERIAKEYEANITDGAQQFLFKSLSEMTQPKNWLDLSGDLFNMDMHKLSEKPFVSGISDIEERMAYVNDSWKKLLQDNQQYHSLVMKSWVSAYEQFINTVKEQQANDEDKLFSPRELIDLWTNIANKELMTLHRSDNFLAAQKDMIKASMEYRLHEKNIAEVLCESLHIPTRMEVDELHQSVTELKRELRKTKQRIQQLEAIKDKPKSRNKSASKTTPPKQA